MKVTVLIENTTCNANLKEQHGLSFYIEHNGLKILFDCGSNGLFLENAQKLGIDISAVDYLIISHGHFDHGGGLGDFIKANDKAKIVINQRAFDDYYFKVLFIKKYIGLDKSLKNNERIIFTNQDLTLDDNIIVFTNITGDKHRSSKSELLKRENGKLVPDDFKHEQCLIIDNVVFAGCSHSGIVNIYEKSKGITNINYIFGGFHLYNPATKKTEDKVLIENIANEFKNEDVNIYTGHCTGKNAFKILKSILGGKVEEISTGISYTVNQTNDSYERQNASR
jgi:7,8-dihydropterin-6-yl-methyl-4-(beta-D-ribofuranosyl)aminobenzene 5'-phosphate synthase